MEHKKKINITGAVSSVKGKELNETPVANISNSIAGRVAGVSMRPNGGQPGMDDPDIHIRGISTTGNNSPLIVVDGVIRSNINEIDPNSIKTVTVLKDAAAVAPYGLGGANGVILITTKNGRIGTPTLSLNAYYGIQSPTYFPHMLSVQDYMRLHNEAYLNENPDGTDLPYSKEFISNYEQLHASDPDKYPMTNASRQIVNMTAPMQNYDLQLSGGTKKVKYYTQLGVFNQAGMFNPVNYRRYNFTVNLQVQATKTTKVSAVIIGSVEKTRSVDAGTSTTQLFRSGFKFVPTANLYYSNGLWGQFAGNSPIGVLNAGYAHTNKNTLLTTLSIEQELPFIKGLSIKGTFSYDPDRTFVKGWHTPYYFYSQDTTTTPYTYTKLISSAEGNVATYTWLNEEYTQTQNFTYQGYLNYHNRFGKHDITGLIVAEARNNTYNDLSARRNHYAVNIDELGMGSSDKSDFDNNGTSSTGSQIGLVYRVGYNYDNKYLFEASGRYDGSYYFAPGKRWGYFPAFSAGWILSRENFFNNISSMVSYFKIRGSWGKSGNLAGTAFQYLSGYNLYGNAYAYGNDKMVQGSSISTEANPNITWEISTKADVGFDGAFWNGLINLSFDYFHERRTGMLLPPAVTVPVEYGLALSDENEGIMVNRGFEVAVNTNHEFSNGMKVGLTGNFSYAKNKMLQIFETEATRSNPHRSRTGRPFGTPFGYHAIGLFKTTDDKNGDGIINSEDGYNVAQFGELHPGDIKYADIDGPDGKPDGKIDSYDEVQIGYPVYPFISYGFTPSLTWKGVDLSLFFQGSALSSFNIQGFQTVPFFNNNSNSAYEYYNNRWTPTHQSSRYPRANQAPYANNTQTSDFWMDNTGYLRLKTAIIGYTLPGKITNSIGMKNLRVYFSGQNLLTFSKLDYMDPEVGYTDGETAYPTQKAYVFGLNVTF
jgi:TonB-linked SusC/RagA family outer membrane protein